MCPPPRLLPSAGDSHPGLYTTPAFDKMTINAAPHRKEWLLRNNKHYRLSRNSGDALLASPVFVPGLLKVCGHYRRLLPLNGANLRLHQGRKGTPAEWYNVGGRVGELATRFARETIITSHTKIVNQVQLMPSATNREDYQQGH